MIVDSGVQQPREHPRLELRTVVVASLTVAAIIGTWTIWPSRPTSDLGFMKAAARALLSGVSPYTVVGPGGSYGGPFHLRYPITAVLVVVPFVPLSLRAADALWAGLSTFALAAVLTRNNVVGPRLTVFASISFFAALQTSQWSPLLIAAALTPPFGFLLAAKPTIGAALWLAYPSRRALAGSVIFLMIATAIWPTWIAEWRVSLGVPSDMVPPIAWPGGFLILACLLEWRRPEARLVTAMACVPQTPLLYEAVPLFLVPSSWAEGVYLLLATAGVLAIVSVGRPYSSYEAWTTASGRSMTWLLYLPCTAMILRPRVQHWLSTVRSSRTGAS